MFHKAQVFIIVLGLASALVPAQSVLDKLKSKVDQLNKAAQKQAPPQQQGQPQQQPPSQSGPGSQAGNAARPETSASPGDVAALAATAGFVDIQGVKLGMSVKDTMLALRAANPDLKLTPSTFRLVGLGDQDLLDSVHAMTLNQKEYYYLSFTLPPSPEVLWSIQHVISFPEKERPTTGNVRAELLKKYGPDSGWPGNGALIWVFDTRGNLLPKNLDWLNFRCNPGVVSLQGEITNGYNSATYKLGSAEKDCSGLVLVKAEIRQGGAMDGTPQQPVESIYVIVENVALHRASVEATRPVALGAQKAQDAKDASDTQKRAVPKF
jgi:hypothetical protein